MATKTSQEIDMAARDTNYRRHGKDFYRRIGRKGGRAKNPNKGFGSSPARAKVMGITYGHLSGPARKMKRA